MGFQTRIPQASFHWLTANEFIISLPPQTFCIRTFSY